jgi:hypothetical protein
MTLYDSMTPFEVATKNEQMLPERPVLHLRTPEATPTKADDTGFDLHQWNDPSWHNHPQPDSPQSLPSLDQTSPTAEDLSHSPRCGKCGLTTRQQKVAAIIICGHVCRDIAQDHFCPDIDALQLSSKDCPIHNPSRKSRPRRRSSLSQPPMLTRDDSTFKDMDEETDVVESPVDEHTVEINELPEDKQSVKIDQSKPPEQPLYHVSHNAEGDADWRKHCRVEKAMQQMLFGNARVSAHTMLEHTQKLRAMSINQDAMGGVEHDKLCSAMAAAKSQAEKHTEECRGGMETDAWHTELEIFKAAQAEAAEHNHDCAICSDYEEGVEGEEEGREEFHDAITSATKGHGCASDDECSSCAEDPASALDLGADVPEESPQRWMDRSRAC